MAGSFDFLHVRRRTAGSSNELSFDVLEHKSDEAAGKAARNPKAPKAPKASQGSYHGVGSSATFSGLPEVEKRKKARQASRMRGLVLGFVVVAAVVAFVAVGVYAGLRAHDERVDAESQIDDLVGRLSEVDETLMEIDQLMIDPLNDDEAQSRADMLSRMPKLKTELNKISVDTQSLLSLQVDEQAEIAIGQLTKAAQGRSGMLNAATEAFNLSHEASEQVARSHMAWNAVLSADQAARDAIAEANRASTPEATSRALDSIRSAKGGFEDARTEVESISQRYGADFSAQRTYLEKKIEALEYAASTSEALLAGNREAAHAANDAYNAADAEAAKQAEALPASIGDIVQARFEHRMSGVIARYNEARDKVVSADSVIRGYLQQKA